MEWKKRGTLRFRVPEEMARLAVLSCVPIAYVSMTRHVTGMLSSTLAYHHLFQHLSPCAHPL